MSHYFYITPEEYEEASKNGVSAGLLEYRIRTANWSKARAIVTPPRKFKDRSKWAKVAKENGINYQAFLRRVNTYGWSEERAANEPMHTTEQFKRRMRICNPVKRKYPVELIKKAEKNGISRNTFSKRVSCGWSWERAATEPLVSNSEKGRRGIRTLRERYGDVNRIIFQKRQ
ncbi:hypothetical protein P7H06_09040 [Paenibacillus larvae]|nr:hypothetical protein [Paenibacillus larvae]MDT2259634.1 hypothetical protein [Paenibacillus larvae]MDT2275148.1 hypothetical protein [Paenibacillus larvae]